jgi:hypothetical protein
MAYAGVTAEATRQLGGILCELLEAMFQECATEFFACPRSSLEIILLGRWFVPKGRSALIPAERIRTRRAQGRAAILNPRRHVL